MGYLGQNEKSIDFENWRTSFKVSASVFVIFSVQNVELECAKRGVDPKSVSIETIFLLGKTNTRAKTRKLLQVCNNRLIQICSQVVFELLHSSRPEEDLTEVYLQLAGQLHP